MVGIVTFCVREDDGTSTLPCQKHTKALTTHDIDWDYSLIFSFSKLSLCMDELPSVYAHVAHNERGVVHPCILQDTISRSSSIFVGVKPPVSCLWPPRVWLISVGVGDSEFALHKTFCRFMLLDYALDVLSCIGMYSVNDSTRPLDDADEHNSA